ncbi:unnamed protein product [Oppiella nova]|uniref:Uncharacterized protein n=1 Tax=Oppiella nova TaxID=334625 RepID=A0A7R9MSX0_9ACAR|nr:unnamed protein product [Oppiella nova]CAG2182715.1 unnamed protein product [Oppiella nova]
MSNSEEEKFALNKQIQEMQNALRAAQSSGSRRNTQSAQQLEEGRPQARPPSATGAPPGPPDPSKAPQQQQRPQQQQQQQQQQQFSEKMV